MSAPALLLWDGQCGFCRRSVEWAQRRDTGHTFQAVSADDIQRVARRIIQLDRAVVAVVGP